MNLELANALITAALSYRRAEGMKPLTIAVIDAGGHLLALQREDGTSNLRAEIAQGKAKGAVAMGLGSRALFNRAQEQPVLHKRNERVERREVGARARWCVD